MAQLAQTGHPVTPKIPGVLSGSGIAATATGTLKCKVYCQDAEGVIREYTCDGDAGWRATRTTFSAKLFSPLAAVSYYSDNEIHVYCVSEDGYLEEWCYSSREGGWRSGPLTDSKFPVAPNTGLAALCWFENGPKFRVYAQEPESDRIQEYCGAGGNPWKKGKTLPVAHTGTGLAAVCWQQNGIHIRVYCQAPDMTLREHRWDGGKFSTSKMPGRTLIAAVGWYQGWYQSGGHEVRVYFQDAGKNIAAYKWSGGWSFDGTLIGPLRPGSIFSALEWKTGRELRLYYQADDDMIHEQCQTKTWFKGSFVGS